MGSYRLLEVAGDLELAGLVWQPEIGDEVSLRENFERISILVDTCGLTPSQLRNQYLWLPTVEQMVTQFEVRQALLFHAGIELSEHALFYKTVVQSSGVAIEGKAPSLRLSMGIALRDLLLVSSEQEFH